MTQSAVGATHLRADMVSIPGDTFRMGSDRHYREERPSHRVTAAPFWIDRTPVANRQFRQFVEATGYVTVAEIAPDPKDYSGARSQMLKPGSLVFVPPRQVVDLRGVPSLRPQLLSPPRTCRATCAAGRHRREPCRVSGASSEVNQERRTIL